jgi:hypothetical protein
MGLKEEGATVHQFFGFFSLLSLRTHGVRCAPLFASRFSLCFSAMDRSFLHASEFSVQFLYPAETSNPDQGSKMHAAQVGITVGSTKAFENK